MVQEIQRKYLIYNNAFVRANRLHRNSLFPRKPEAHLEKIRYLVNSFKSKREDCKLLLIKGNNK